VAETLGSLIDKLSIIDLKLWHCQEALYKSKQECPPDEIEQLKTKNESLLRQRQRFVEEINEWFAQAMTEPEKIIFTNPSNKMYGRFRKE
jgi:hypothetical protein